MREKILFILGLFALAPAARAQTWTWTGFEIVGQRSVSRAEIEKFIPIEIGTEYRQESERWKQICEDIREHFNFFQAKCSAVLYVDHRSYLTVDIIERGDEERVKFRAVPDCEIVL